MSLHRLTSITVGVPNVAETAAYYTDFGLTPTGPTGLRFATQDGGEQLELVAAPQRRLLQIGLGAQDEDDLGRIEAQLARLDVTGRRTEAGLTYPLGDAFDVTCTRAPAPVAAPPGASTWTVSAALVTRSHFIDRFNEAALESSRMPVARVFIVWSYVQTKSDQWDFHLFDTAFRAAESHQSQTKRVEPRTVSDEAACGTVPAGP